MKRLLISSNVNVLDQIKVARHEGRTWQSFGNSGKGVVLVVEHLQHGAFKSLSQQSAPVRKYITNVFFLLTHFWNRLAEVFESFLCDHNFVLALERNVLADFCTGWYGRAAANLLFDAAVLARGHLLHVTGVGEI